jgi:hypothetical protein
MVCLDQSTRYICRSTTPSPPAPLPRSGFVHRPSFSHQLFTENDWLTVCVLSASRLKERTLSTPYAAVKVSFLNRKP